MMGSDPKKLCCLVEFDTTSGKYKKRRKKGKKGVDKRCNCWYYMQAASRAAEITEKLKKEFEKSS